VTSRALINPLPKNSGVSLRATIQNPRPRKYASDADRQKAFRERQAVIQVRVKPETVETFDRIASTLGYSRQEVVYALLMSGLNNNRNWQQTGIPAFRLPRYEENPTMRKATPAQLAARERFAEMARSGAFKRKAKAAPKRKKNPISDIAQTIYEQLGADRFAFMTGAKNIVGLDEGLMFSIPRNQSPYNKVRITLTPDDLYNVEFFKMNRLGDISKQTEYPGMYADQLRALFTRVTGLETSLGTMGRRSNPAKKTVSQKISQLTREGYPQRQAVAIALSEQRAGKVKKNPLGVAGGRYEIVWAGSGDLKGSYDDLGQAKDFLDDIDRPPGLFYGIDTKTGKRFYSFAAETKMLGKVKRNPAEAKERKPRVVLITNPAKKALGEGFYLVSVKRTSTSKWAPYQRFHDWRQAEDYSHYLADRYPNWTIRMHDTRAM